MSKKCSVDLRVLWTLQFEAVQVEVTVCGCFHKREPPQGPVFL